MHTDPIFAMTTSGQAGNAVTTWNYDAGRGWLLNKRDANNHGANYTYTAGGRLSTRTWARGTATTYGYNTAGDLTGVDYSDGTPDVVYTPSIAWAARSR
jgi:YD repeat-containing protein